MFLFGNRRQPRDILDEQIKSAVSEISKVLRRERGSTMSAVVIAIHNQSRVHEILDQANVPSDVFAQSMGDLNNSPGTSEAIPPRASNGQSICARELETMRLDRYSKHGLSVSWVTGWILERALR
jgi:hypothetical protein